MKPLSLTLHNFMSFRGRHERALADLGLVSILGQNEVDLGEDANGAGKSTIIDALLWGLFGETGPRKDSLTSKGGLSTDDVVNEVEGKDCYVVVDFEAAGRTYRVERWRKASKKLLDTLGGEKANGVHLLELHPGHITERGDEWATVADLDADNVQGKIDAAAGIDLALASQVLVRSQEDPFNFAQATPSERFAILTRIEGLDALDGRAETARARSRELGAEIVRVEARANGARATIDLMRREDLRAQAAEWETTRAGRLAELQARLDAKTAELQAGAALSARPQLLAQLQAIDAAIAACDAQRPAMPPELEQWRRHRADLERAAGALTARAHALTAQAHKLARIDASASTGMCTECEQVVPIAHVLAKRAALEAEGAQIKAESAANDAARAQADATVGQIETTWAQHRHEVDRVRNEHVNAKMAVTSEMQRLDGIERNLARVQGEIGALQRDIDVARREANPWSQRAQATASKLAQLEAELSADEVELQRLKAEQGYVEWWLKNIPSMKAWIFDNVMGVLTSEANRWLAHLMGGSCWVQIDSSTTTKAGDVRDKIGLRCFRWLPEGGFVERPFRRWSGGEKRRIALALDWALSQRLAQRAGASCDFIALDEVDRHLDKAGRDGLRAALEELRKEKSTVIVVSHDAELRMSASSRWLVVKDKDGSRIEVSSGQEDQGQQAA